MALPFQLCCKLQFCGDFNNLLKTRTFPTLKKYDVVSHPVREWNVWGKSSWG